MRGSESPDLLDTFSNLFIAVVHDTYQHVPCLVAIVGCAHAHHLVHYTNINTIMSCCFC